MGTTSRLLAGLCLLAAAPLAMAGHGPKRPAPRNVIYQSWTVVGYGPTIQDAQTSALEKASQSVGDYLAKSQPGLAWTPPASYLTQRGIVRTIGHPDERELQITGRTFEVTLGVDITQALIEDAPKMSRQRRMEERQRTLALGLGGAVCLLVVLAGYLRLEEATRGYYTRALRLTAAGVLAAVGAGLWLLR
jgi:hypothetical protein